jgi:hypothetical protein
LVVSFRDRGLHSIKLRGFKRSSKTESAEAGMQGRNKAVGLVVHSEPSDPRDASQRLKSDSVPRFQEIFVNSGDRESLLGAALTRGAYYGDDSLFMVHR